MSDIGSDIGSLLSDVEVLAQKEVQLARAEMGESVGHATRALVYGGATFIFAWLMLAFAAATLMFVLDEAMRLWLAALITTGVLVGLTALAGLLMYARIRQISVTPKRAMKSVREDVEWARNQLNWNAK